MAKRETNVQAVKRLMESGSPLMQAFVIEAITKYANVCAEQPAEVFDSSLLHGQAWVDCGKRAKQWSEELYGK